MSARHRLAKFRWLGLLTTIALLIQLVAWPGSAAAQDGLIKQGCTYEIQAEQLIKANPLNPRNLIAGQNDGRIGFNKCGFDYSLNGGKTWGDGVPPFYARLNNPPTGHTVAGGRGTNHTYDA